MTFNTLIAGGGINHVLTLYRITYARMYAHIYIYMGIAAHESMHRHACILKAYTR